MRKTRIGRLTIGFEPRVVGSITSLKGLQRAALRRSPPFDIAEVRLDLIGPQHSEWRELARRIHARGTPVLLTIRSSKEGGAWIGSERERARLYRQALPHVSAIDVEIGSPIFGKLCAAASNLRKTVIGSFHDFKRVPSLARMKQVVAKGRRGGADIVKIAAMVKRVADERPLFLLLAAQVGVSMCVIGMGKKGVSTRVSLPLAGSCLAYGSVDSAAAPGQIPCAELRRLLRGQR